MARLSLPVFEIAKLSLPRGDPLKEGSRLIDVHQTKINDSLLSALWIDVSHELMCILGSCRAAHAHQNGLHMEGKLDPYKQLRGIDPGDRVRKGRICSDIINEWIHHVSEFLMVMW